MRAPRLALKLISLAALVWILCAQYSIHLNPEVRFYAHLSKLQDQYAQQLDRSGTNKIVVYGGSSCMFSVDGNWLLANEGLPVLNRGLGAGMGAKISTLHALKNLHRGDTLIVALEPGQLTEPADLTSLAIQFSYAVDHPEWPLDDSLELPGCGRVSGLMALRPGGYHFMTLLGKLAQGRDLFRYNVRNANASGFMVTDVRLEITGPPGHGPKLSEDANKFLPALRRWCESHGVRVAYSLPWGYCPSDQLAAFRKYNANTLGQIAVHIPVLKEEQLGADPLPEHFADTAWHLTAAGAKLRSQSLGRSLKDWQCWRPEELHSLAAPSQ